MLALHVGEKAPVELAKCVQIFALLEAAGIGRLAVKSDLVDGEACVDARRQHRRRDGPAQRKRDSDATGLCSGPQSARCELRDRLAFMPRPPFSAVSVALIKVRLDLVAQR